MNNKLTNEEITKVFAMYIPGKFINGATGDDKQRDLTYDNIKTLGYSKIGPPKLLLTSLSSISDEDAESVAKIADGWAGDPRTGRELITQYLNNSRCVVTGESWWDIFQYLISKSYAVPLFFSPEHWANGKTAIELEIAIEK